MLAHLRGIIHETILIPSEGKPRAYVCAEHNGISFVITPNEFLQIPGWTVRVDRTRKQGYGAKVRSVASKATGPGYGHGAMTIQPKPIDLIKLLSADDCGAVLKVVCMQVTINVRDVFEKLNQGREDRESKAAEKAGAKKRKVV